MLPFADGSDLGASVRNPAAFCNLVGLRPTPGRIPTLPPGDPWDPFAVHGPIARTAPDAALLFEALAGPDPRDPLSISRARSPRASSRSPGSRIGWSRDLGGLPIDPAVTAVLESLRATLTDLGFVVEDAEPDFEGADECFEVLRGVGFAGALRRDRRRGQADAGREHAVRALAERGPDRARPRAPRRDVHADAGVPDGYDVLAAPVTAVPAFDVETEYPTEVAGVPMGTYLEWFRTCSRITVTAHPSVAVPAGFTDAGLPIGIQLVGRHRGERALLRLAHAINGATGLPDRTPPL